MIGNLWLAKILGSLRAARCIDLLLEAAAWCVWGQPFFLSLLGL